MAGKVYQITDLIRPDQLGCDIANLWVSDNTSRQEQMASWKEIRQYLYATDTTQTSNSKLPWKNKTTVPKLTQIYDNLKANYLASIFPRSKWLEWLASNKSSASMDKRECILNYMQWAITQPQFKAEISKCLDDYITMGNCFAMPEWIDSRINSPERIQTGYVGPVPRRISPLDLTMNPVAPSFVETRKIVRSLISMGELKKKLESMSVDENREEYKDIYNYVKELRQNIHTFGADDISIQDSYLQMDGFSSFRQYLEGDYVEILTFYGDIYDQEKSELLQNHVIMVVDRHKVIAKKPNPSYFGYPPIFHAAWRTRSDNLWGMSPLANLVGLQYRLDHIENLKSDVFDLIAYPVLKIKGYVNDFEWGPMQRIVTDQEGDVEMVAPPFQILQVNNEIAYLVGMMEEMAGAPKEAMGFRTPGEKTALEVQKLENAASRIFQHKIMQFEEQFLEPLLNSMLEMARRNIQGPTEINVFDNEFKMQTFMTLTADDITGAGRLKPMAARHFAEKSQAVQNLVSLYQSGLMQDPLISMHLSGVKMSKALESLLDLDDFELYQEYVRVSEQAQAERLQNANMEQTMMQASTPAGLTPGDDGGPDIAPQIPMENE